MPPKFGYAIAELNKAREAVDTNAPKNEAEGNFEQAKLERDVGRSCGSAIEMLRQMQHKYNRPKAASTWKAAKNVNAVQ